MNCSQLQSLEEQVSDVKCGTYTWQNNANTSKRQSGIVTVSGASPLIKWLFGVHVFHLAT